MKILRYILFAIAGAVAFVAGFLLGKDRKPPGTITTEEKETIYDTIPYFAPMPKSELVVGTHSYTLPSYCFLGGGAGGEPRQRPQKADDKIVKPDTTTRLNYGTGAGGEPRCSIDSAMVELPIIQRHYADSIYEAWVSGPIDPQLDSMKVFVPTTIITKREWKPPKRWHIGVTAGYGYGAKGFQPYIGVGVTYSIFSF